MSQDPLFVEQGHILSTSANISTLDYGEPPVEPAVGEETYYGFTASGWAKIFSITALMVALFWPNLRRLWEKTNPITGEANWGHSCLIPLIGLYYLYINRDALGKAPVRALLPGKLTRGRIKSVAWFAAAALFMIVMPWLAPSVWGGQGGNVQSLGVATAVLALFALTLDWGVGTLLYGMLMYGYGIWPGQNDFVKDFGMVITLFGVVLTLCGWDVMKIAWFPIAFLVCGIPWPGLVYSWVASPLQALAAEVAVLVMRLTGVNAFRSGTKINMGGLGSPLRTLNVAEACAGMRSLMTFISVAAALAFLSSRPLWQKFIVTLSAIPIAIFCNVMRVAGQGVLDHYVSQQLSESFAHQFVGLVMLIPAFFMILGVCWLLDQIFVEELDEMHTGANAGLAGTTGGIIEIPRPRSTTAPTASPAGHPSGPSMLSVTPPPTTRLTPPRSGPAGGRGSSSSDSGSTKTGTKGEPS